MIGTVQAFALACGVLFVSLYGGFLDSLTGLLFGTFLGISDGQVVTLAAVGVVVLLVLAVIGRPLFFATVDADVAAARRVPVRALSVVFLLVLGCTAAEVSQITGALLVFALLVMPAAAAQQLTARPVCEPGADRGHRGWWSPGWPWRWPTSRSTRSGSTSPPSGSPPTCWPPPSGSA